MFAEPRLSGRLTLLLAATCAQQNYWTRDELQTYNSPKLTLYFNGLSDRHEYFYWSRKTFSRHKIVVNPEIMFEFKGIHFSFLSSLIFLQLPHTKKAQVNGVSRKKKASDTKFRISQGNLEIHRQPLPQIIQPLIKPLGNPNTSIKYQSFVYAQLNDQTFLFLTIQVSIIHFLHTV